jgi:hypothetical protein
MSLEVDDLDFSPVVAKVLGHKPSMTMSSCWLSAKEDSATLEEIPRNAILDPALRHEVQEAMFILGPRDTVLSVVVEQLLRRRELQLMHVLGVADLLQKVGKIIALREAR